MEIGSYFIVRKNQKPINEGSFLPICIKTAEPDIGNRIKYQPNTGYNKTIK